MGISEKVNKTAEVQKGGLTDLQQLRLISIMDHMLQEPLHDMSLLVQHARDIAGPGACDTVLRQLQDIINAQAMRCSVLRLSIPQQPL